MNTYTFNVIYYGNVEETVIVKASNVMEAHQMVKVSHPYTWKIEIMGVKSNV